MIHKAKTLPSDAEYYSSKLTVEQYRLLPSWRALGLVNDEAAIEHDGALDNLAFELSLEWLRSPETRKIVEQNFVLVKLRAKTDAAEGQVYFFWNFFSNVKTHTLCTETVLAIDWQ